MSHYDIVIIGGGISGLVKAYKLSKAGKKIMLIEKSDILGGSIQTYYSRVAKDYWLEMGGHTLYNSYEKVLELVNELELDKNICKRKKLPFKLYINKRFRSIFCGLNIVKIAYGFIKFKFLSKRGKTLSQYYRNIFGTKNYDRTLKHIFNGVLLQDSENFPAELLFNFHKKDKSYPRSFTFDKGLSLLLEALINKTFCTFACSTSVKFLERSDRKWNIDHSFGKVTANSVIMAIPPDEAFKLLSKSNLHHPCISLLNEIDHSYVYSLGVIFKKDSVIHIPELAGCIGVGQKFYSMVSRDIIDHKDYRGFVFHFKEEIDLTDDDYLSMIEGYLNIKKEDILDYTFKHNKVPKMSISFLNRSHELGDFFESISIELIGNYFSRLSIEDCVSKAY